MVDAATRRAMSKVNASTREERIKWHQKRDMVRPSRKKLNRKPLSQCPIHKYTFIEIKNAPAKPIRRKKIGLCMCGGRCRTVKKQQVPLIHLDVFKGETWNATQMVQRRYYQCRKCGHEFHRIMPGVFALPFRAG